MAIACDVCGEIYSGDDHICEMRVRPISKLSSIERTLEKAVTRDIVLRSIMDTLSAEENHRWWPEDFRHYIDHWRCTLGLDAIEWRKE